MIEKIKDVSRRYKKYLIGFLIAVIFTVTITIFANAWSNNNKLIWRNPIKQALVFQGFMLVQKREPERIYIGKEQLDEFIDASGNRPIAEKVIEKFGAVYGVTALQILKAESGLNPNALHVNDNKTVDLGCVQINSIHFNKDFTPADALDCDKALDWMEKKARNDAVSAGSKEKYIFTAWAAYNNGSFMAVK